MDVSWPLGVFRYCPHCGGQEGAAVSIKQFICPDCGFQYFSNAGAEVMAIIQNQQGELLFTRRARDPAKGLLDFPGGFVDPLESAEQALVREIQEELSLEVDSYRFFRSFPNRYTYAGVLYHTTDLAFLCTPGDLDAIVLQDDEVTEVVYRRPQEVKREEVGLDSVWNAVQAFMECAL